MTRLKMGRLAGGPSVIVPKRCIRVLPSRSAGSRKPEPKPGGIDPGGWVDSDGRAGQAASPREPRGVRPPPRRPGPASKHRRSLVGPGGTIRVDRVRAFCRFDPRGDRRIAAGGGTRRPADPVRRARPARSGPVAPASPSSTASVTIRMVSLWSSSLGGNVTSWPCGVRPDFSAASSTSWMLVVAGLVTLRICTLVRDGFALGRARGSVGEAEPVLAAEASAIS